MERTIVGFLAASLFWGSTVALAGGWASSGGGTLIYDRNPWFVRNTASVDYCIQMDEPSFSIPKADVERLIGEAIQFWKAEFQRNSGGFTNMTYGFAKIATQTFNYVPQCSATTPLIFKLGAKFLDSQEISNSIQDPKKFVGVTIRKTYDEKALQGSGIIYITADLGPDAYANTGLLIDKAWKNPALFKYAVIHELGHFFGIPHVGSGIMSEVFMTMLLNKNMVDDFNSPYQIGVLNPPSSFEVCRGNSQFNPDFFQVPTTTTCLKFETQPGVALPAWTVSAKPQSGAYSVIGEMKAIAMDEAPNSLKTAVIVQLPDTQSVFTPLESVAGPFMVGAVFSDTTYLGSFQPKGSVRGIALQMSLSAEKVAITGNVNNQLMTVLTYSSLDFMKAIFP